MKVCSRNRGQAVSLYANLRSMRYGMRLKSAECLKAPPQDLPPNWIPLGLTTGRGKADMSNRPNRPLKQVLAYPLDKGFRRLLEA